MDNAHDGASSAPHAAERPVDRRVVRTKKAIRRALFKLMEKQDYHKITIAAIAREADIDRKTFYLHYESVDAVADEVVQDEADRIVALCRRSMREDGSKGEAVVELFGLLSVGFASDCASARRMAAHLPVDEVLERLEHSLTEALIDDDFLGLAAMGPYLTYCVSFFCAGIVAVYRRWLLSDSEIPLEDLARMTNRAALTGIEGIIGSVQPDRA